MVLPPMAAVLEPRPRTEASPLAVVSPAIAGVREQARSHGSTRKPEQRQEVEAERLERRRAGHLESLAAARIHARAAAAALLRDA
jgi:hypothetical protein